jgi:uncharacterized protein (TIGR02453 family)
LKTLRDSGYRREKMAKTYFQPAFFRFLKELEKHNHRDWFSANKPRFESDVRDPMLAFIGELQPRLAKLSRHIVVDPRPVGGSLFRIHRDVRFSADKSPYKTHMAAHFSHAGCEGSAPGFYLRLEPGQSLAGAGVWHPEAEALGRIREAMVAAPNDWKRATQGLRLDGEVLKRPPRGCDPQHPLIEDLKRKDFITGTTYTESKVCASDFLDRFVEDCRTRAPLVRFLCRALGLPF